jgi:hypothetical protein
MAKKKSRWKPFEQWLKQEVENEFQLVRSFHSVLLNDFLTQIPTLTAIEMEKAEALREKLFFFVDSWNEDDLKLNFIGPILQVIDFQQPKYRVFYNAFLKITLQGAEIAGRVDGVLAKGSQIPEKPLFFLQEYKPEKLKNSDPLGQLLVAMVAAQVINKNHTETLYGCYIMGRNWFFVELTDKEYAVSNAYDATNHDVFKIVAILSKIKQLYIQKIS